MTATGRTGPEAVGGDGETEAPAGADVVVPAVGVEAGSGAAQLEIAEPPGMRPVTVEPRAARLESAEPPGMPPAGVRPEATQLAPAAVQPGVVLDTRPAMPPESFVDATPVDATAQPPPTTAQPEPRAGQAEGTVAVGPTAGQHVVLPEPPAGMDVTEPATAQPAASQPVVPPGQTTAAAARTAVRSTGGAAVVLPADAAAVEPPDSQTSTVRPESPSKGQPPPTVAQPAADHAVEPPATQPADPDSTVPPIAQPGAPSVVRPAQHESAAVETAASTDVQSTAGQPVRAASQPAAAPPVIPPAVQPPARAASQPAAAPLAPPATPPTAGQPVRAAQPATAQPTPPATQPEPAPASTQTPAQTPTPWRRFTAAQSRLLGAVVERLIRVTGGQCATVHGLRVCREGRLRLHAKGGTQLGDTFVTEHEPERLRRGLIAHESHHRDAQWRRYGLVFGVMYLYAHLRDVVIGKKCCNRYELAAEVASNGGGGYGCLPPEPPPDAGTHRRR